MKHSLNDLLIRQSRINDFRTGEVEIQSVADLDRKLRLLFTLTHAGEVDVSGAFREYTESGTTLTRPFEATQVRNREFTFVRYRYRL